jgi:tagatose 1,6-diphosphate aldolase
MTTSPKIESFPNPPDTLSFSEVRLRFVRVVPGDPSRDFVPAYHFRILVTDGSDVGHINFRVGDTEHVRVCAGTLDSRFLSRFVVTAMRLRRAVPSHRSFVHFIMP